MQGLYRHTDSEKVDKRRMLTLAAFFLHSTSKNTSLEVEPCSCRQVVPSTQNKGHTKVGEGFLVFGVIFCESHSSDLPGQICPFVHVHNNPDIFGFQTERSAIFNHQLCLSKGTSLKKFFAKGKCSTSSKLTFK